MTGPKAPAVISLGMTKGGKRMGVAESVTLSSGGDALWRKLFSACLNALSDPTVFDVGEQRFGFPAT